MDQDKYDFELEKTKIQEETKRNLYENIFWIAFLFLVIGGCTITEVAH